MSNQNEETDELPKPTLDHVLKNIGYESLEQALESRLEKIKLLRETRESPKCNDSD